MQIEDGFNEQVFTLFLIFSRMEYALTRTDGFARGDNNVPVYANWARLAEELGQSFFDEQRNHPDRGYLWSNPPGRWVATFDQAGKLTPAWQDRQASTELQRLFDPISWVRNCIIHGESQDAVPRYMCLVRASIEVLEAALAVCLARNELKKIADGYTASRIQAPQ